MVFSITCINKECKKQMNPYIDPKTDKVYCESCDQEILTITYFAKVQMKNLKQYKKKSSTSFSIKCPKCNKDDRPKLINNEIVCSKCNSPMDHLTEPFKIMLKEKLKTASQDI